MDEYQSFKSLLEKHGFETPRCISFVSPGWWPILEDLLPKLKTAGVKTVDQIKEKFGGLRVYTGSIENDSNRHLVATLIREAETKAWKTCEVCGDPGVLRTEGWYMVRCQSCNETDK
jgi:hypothetical protein